MKLLSRLPPSWRVPVIFITFGCVTVAWQSLDLSRVIADHIYVVVCIWLATPVLAKLIARDASQFDIRDLRRLRFFVRAVVLVGSLFVLMNYERVRDDLGGRLVPGYHVTEYEEDSDRGPTLSRVASGGSTMSTIAIRVAELIGLALLLGVPAVVFSLTEDLGPGAAGSRDSG